MAYKKWGITEPKHPEEAARKENLDSKCSYYHDGYHLEFRDDGLGYIYEGFAEEENLQDFLWDYRALGDGDPFTAEESRSSTIWKDQPEPLPLYQERSLKKLCEACQYSSCKGSFSGCDIEEDFVMGHKIHLYLKPPKPEHTICPSCGRRMVKDGHTNITMHDIRLQGRVTSLQITYEQYRCSGCNTRLPRSRIEHLQTIKRGLLTTRLQGAIAEGYSRKYQAAYLAEGYGLRQSSVKKLVAQLQQNTKRDVMQKRLAEIEKEYQPKGITRTRWVKEESLTINGEPYTVIYTIFPDDLVPRLCAIYRKEDMDKPDHCCAATYFLQPASHEELICRTYDFCAARTQAPPALGCLMAELFWAYSKLSGDAWTESTTRQEEFEDGLDTLWDEYKYGSTLGTLWIHANTLLSLVDIAMDSSYFQYIKPYINKIIAYLRSCRDHGVPMEVELSALLDASEEYTARKEQYEARWGSNMNITGSIFGVQGDVVINSPEGADFIIGRLLYFNEAALLPALHRLESDGNCPFTTELHIHPDYLPTNGVPVSCLRHLIQNGLLDEARVGEVPCADRLFRKPQLLQQFSCHGEYCLKHIEYQW